MIETATNQVVRQAGEETEDVLVFPASSGQRRLWFLDQAEPSTALYNVAKGLRLRGTLDERALQAALGEIVRRHEMLRTTFEVSGGEPVQVVHTALPAAFDIVDLSDVAADERDRSAARLAAEEARRPFDLSAGPLMRVRLFRLGRSEHVLIFTLHHIACDGWSMGVLFNELAEIYNALRLDRPARLPNLDMQYGDFAVWEQEHLAEPGVLDSLAHWTKRLAGAPVLNLPADRRRPTRPSLRGATARRTIPPALAEAARVLARRYDSTLFVTGLALFAALLHRYGGDEDIVIGAPVANRDHPEFQSIIGFFVNTLALRLDLSGDPTVGELLERVRRSAFESFRHQDVPLDKVVEALHPDRKGRTNPLFQVMYAFESEWSPAPFRMDGLEVSSILIEPDTAKFDLTLFFQDNPGETTALLEFSTDVYDAATADRLLGHFHQMLEAAVADPDQRVSALPLMTPAERRQVLEEWNRTAREYPHDTPIPDLVAAQVARRPHAPAIVDGARTLSYEELDRRASVLAARLRAHGVGRGVAVSLCASRGANQVAAMLAILKAGGVYVPLDPAHPRERLTWLMEDVGARVAVVQHRYRDLFDPAIPLIDLDSGLEGEPPAGIDPSAGAAATDPAYIIYTSGSTGRPKGAIVSQRAIARLILNTNYVALDERDVVAQASNAAFDAATFEIWGALLTGASLSIVDTETVLSAERLGREIRRAGITVMFLTTSLFNQIAREDPTVFRPLRYLLFGGEAADPAAVSAVHEHGRPQHLVNAYGPTETTTFATAFEVTALPDTEAALPIGRPIANTCVYVLDRQMNPVPCGVPGELYIGGPGVALGYHARPELTAERFVPDRFSADPAARLYRTGDLVRYRPDGNIEFIGRVDNQVKIRGFRVEPGEIETALRGVPGVEEACVLTDTDPAGIVRLLAYVGAPAGVTPAHLRERLKHELPPYMIPGEIAVLDRLPINANGKVDRASLRSIAVRPAAGAPTVTAPRDPLETMLAEIWERLLGVAPVGVRDDFFELGGHSLLAARMIGEVEQAIGRRVPLSVLLQHPTIESLADQLVEAQVSSHSPLVRLNEHGTRRPLFFLHGDMNGGGFYSRQLARHLDPDRPLYVLQPHGLGATPLPPSIDSMAALHIDTVRAAQPRGPYLLAGYCNGGLIALEIARQLQEQGEQVQLVAIISASAASTRLAIVDHAVREWARRTGMSDARRVALFLSIRAFVERVTQATGQERARYVAGRLANVLRRLAGRKPEARQAAALSVADAVEPGEEAPIRHAADVFATYARAVGAYVPGRYEGRVAALLTGQGALLAQHAADWRRKIPRLEVHPIEGDHTTCITRHVESLARVLDECIKADSR